MEIYLHFLLFPLWLVSFLDVNILISLKSNNSLFQFATPFHIFTGTLWRRRRYGHNDIINTLRDFVTFVENYPFPIHDPHATVSKILIKYFISLFVFSSFPLFSWRRIRPIFQIYQDIPNFESNFKSIFTPWSRWQLHYN